MNAVQTQSAAQAMPFRFTGNGGEYFRIWIVNLFLSIITLGIYSAWAKVRRNRYFYGNTRLGNAGFDYLADPKAILRGRLIAVAVFFFVVKPYNAYKARMEESGEDEAVTPSEVDLLTEIRDALVSEGR